MSEGLNFSARLNEQVDELHKYFAEVADSDCLGDVAYYCTFFYRDGPRYFEMRGTINYRANKCEWRLYEQYRGLCYPYQIDGVEVFSDPITTWETLQEHGQGLIAGGRIVGKEPTASLDSYVVDDGADDQRD